MVHKQRDRPQQVLCFAVGKGRAATGAWLVQRQFNLGLEPAIKKLNGYKMNVEYLNEQVNNTIKQAEDKSRGYRSFRKRRVLTSK